MYYYMCITCISKLAKKWDRILIYQKQLIDNNKKLNDKKGPTVHLR
jgi:hypothetical protein